MDREEAERLLNGGDDGVAEFNRRRQDGDEVPELKGVDLSNADLQRVNLSGCDLAGARLDNANLDSATLVATNLFQASLREANLFEADLSKGVLRWADLTQARMVGASLRSANLSWARLKAADLHRAKCRDASFFETCLEGAKLTEADLHSAELTMTDLGDADLRYVKGLHLNNTFIRHARFDSRASDRWSTLRRKYTGPASLFNVILLVGFFAGYGFKAAMWIGVNRSQQAVINVASNLEARARELAIAHPDAADTLDGLADSLGDITPSFTDESRELSIWQVLLAIDQGWALSLLAIMLIAYNLFRWVLTREIAAMRDAEERSGYSPPWIVFVSSYSTTGLQQLFDDSGKVGPTANRTRWEHFQQLLRGYAWLWYLHAWGVRWLFVVAIITFLYHGWTWLTEPVYLPK